MMFEQNGGALSRRELFIRAASLGVGAAGLSLLAGCGGSNNPGPVPTPTPTPDPTLYSGTLTRANEQMRQVLETFLSFNVPPLYTLTPMVARTQRSIQDAVPIVLAARGQSTAPEAVGSVRDTTIPGPASALPVRVYTPVGTGPFPVVVYFHGGGWVIATIDTYDASCRALANLAGAVVISVEYRKGPENPFPAAHEDAYAATQYVINNAAQFGGDPTRVAVAGESAGGNLSVAVCMLARDRGGKMPVYQVPIYPIANNDVNSPSYVENANAVPLNRMSSQYFVENYLPNTAQSNNPLIALNQGNLAGLPPATVITDEIDPLRYEGQQLAVLLQSAGVTVQYRNYTGVTHEFFSLNRVVDAGRDAVTFAAQGLRGAFGR